MDVRNLALLLAVRSYDGGNVDLYECIRLRALYDVSSVLLRFVEDNVT